MTAGVGYRLLISRQTAQGMIGLTIGTETLTLHPSEAHAIGTGLLRHYARTRCWESRHYIETETDDNHISRVRIVMDITTILDMERREGSKYLTLVEMWLSKESTIELSKDLCDYAIQATDPR